MNKLITSFVAFDLFDNIKYLLTEFLKEIFKFISVFLGVEDNCSEGLSLTFEYNYVHINSLYAMLFHNLE